MKTQIRSLLFALVVPVAACGGERETSSVEPQLSDSVQLPKSDATSATTTQPDTVIGTDIKVVDTTKPMPTKLDELMAEGKKLVAEAKYGDAKIMFDAALKLDKKNADIHIEMARMYITMNDKGKSVASANKAVKLAPLSSQAWNTLGRAELNAHKYEEAIVAFTKAVELNDTNVFAWNNLGYTELLLKRYQDAADHLTEATSRPGATGYMFNNLGTALEQLDQLDDARVAYEEGGKLGSKEASSSRKRLEGVDSIAVAVSEPEPTGEVHDDVRAEGPKVKEYELVNEGDIPEVEEESFPPTTNDEETSDDQGSGSSDEEGATTVQPGDNATL